MSGKTNGIERKLGRVSWQDIVGGKFVVSEHEGHAPTFQRDDIARNVFASLMTEWYTEWYSDKDKMDDAPMMPLPAAEILENLGNVGGSVGYVAEGSTTELYFQHPKVIRCGVADAVKPDLIDEAAALAACGSGSPEDWKHAMEAIRSAQFLEDFLGLDPKEDGDRHLYQKGATVARFLVLSLMFDRAVKAGVPIKTTLVPGSEYGSAVALSPDQVLEVLMPERVLDDTTLVELKAFDDVAMVVYHVPALGSIIAGLSRIGEETEKLLAQLGDHPDDKRELDLKLGAVKDMKVALERMRDDTVALARKTNREIPTHKPGANGKEHALTTKANEAADDGRISDPEVAREQAEKDEAAERAVARPLTRKEKKAAAREAKRRRREVAAQADADGDHGPDESGVSHAAVESVTVDA